MLFFNRDKKVVRERHEHCISRSNIDPDAVKVLYRLANTGYTAYLVGGSVRDLLLGRQPKDFDVGTDARPNDIRHLFRNCFLIGRRFRLAHIVFGRKVIETSTFRRQPDESESENGIYQTEDNTFGTPEEDAKRRDFTVNGLFYDIKTFSVIDYVGGLKDLEKRVLRCIGDPNIRFREDPVRMMRAVKFAARLDFEMDRACRKAILKHHADIANASTPRVCEEVFRLFTYSSSAAAFLLLWEFKLMQDILPELSAYIDRSGGKKSPIWSYLRALDAHPQSADLTNGIRAACLYYPLFLELMKAEETAFPHGRINRQHVARKALHSLAERMHVPKATLFTAVALFDVQRRLAEGPKKGRSQRFLRHPIFEEALAFNQIAAAAEGADASALNEWKSLYDQEVAAHAARAAEPSDESVDGVDTPRDAEPLETAPRRRRRRRGPRQGREKSGGAAAEHPHRAPSAITVNEVSAEATRTDGCD